VPVMRTRSVDPQQLLVVAGLVAAVAIVVSSLFAGLPSGTTRATATVALTVLGLGLWAVVLRRRVRAVPIRAACLVGTGLCGAALDLLRPAGPGFILAYMAVAAVAVALPRRVALGCGAVVLTAAASAEAYESDHPVGAALTLVSGGAFFFVCATLAAISRDARAQAEALVAQEAATRGAREEAARLAERGRLARELHDVLAHTLSGLAVQLEGSRLLAAKTDADPRLTAQIDGAGKLARDGMASARNAIDTLRGQLLPGPADLPALIEQAGLPVRYEVTGEPRPLPADAALAVYRTVQEALTNATRYGGTGVKATVALRWSPSEVVAEVVDAGGDRVPADLPSGGYGLAGLAERAALAGGRVDAGPTAEGWRVTVTLPVPA